MFFMRLRNHAKWMFVALAVVFIFSFVVAGVGSGSTGVGDMFSSFGGIFGSGSSTSDALKKAEKQVKKAGTDQAKLAPALHNLGKAQIAKAKYADAEATYTRYLALRPKDDDARRELATAYKNAADVYGTQLTSVESDVLQSQPTRLSGPLDQDAIATEVHTDAVNTATDLYKSFAEPKRKELKGLVQALTVVTPDNRENFLSLTSSEAYGAAVQAYQFATYVGESAQATAARNDSTTWARNAIAAFQGLLKVHAHDSATAQIKQRISDMKQVAGLSGK